MPIQLSGSLVITGSITTTGGITISGSILSASYSDTASFSNNFRVLGDLTASTAVITGTLTAQTLVVQTVTSSIVYSSGSNIFGSALSDRQTFTGSIQASGSSTHFLMGGSVGIGNINPSYSLDISGTIRGTTSAYFATTGGSVGIGSTTIYNGGGFGRVLSIYETSTVALSLVTSAKQFQVGISGTDNDYRIYDFTNTTYRFTINGSTGNVGIGTTSPSASLHVAASTAPFIRIDDIGFNSENGITWQPSGYTSRGSLTVNYLTAEMRLSVGVVGSTYFQTFYTAGVERMRINSAGNIGMGTNSPYVIAAGGPCLDLRGPTWSFIELGTSSTVSGSTDIGYLEFMNGNNTRLATIVGSTDGTALAGLMRFSTANSSGGFTERMRINSAGNIGMGTTNLTYAALNIKASGIYLYNGIALYSTNGTETFLGIGNSGTECGFFATYGASGAYVPIVFCTNGSEKMRITTGGYTKMSSTSTYAEATGLYHECYGGAANGYTLIVTSPVATPLSQYIFDIRFSAATPNNTSARFLHCSYATATRAIIRSNGGLANYQSNNADLSDIRTKKDIISLESYWNKFKALEIVKYKYKDQTHEDYNIGVIAQQVEAVAPEFVDVDGWSKNDIESESPLKSIYTKDLYHATIKVLQEAMAKIETLEAKVTALETK